MKLDTLVRVLDENMSFKIPKDFRKATGKILVTVGEKEKPSWKILQKMLWKLTRILSVWLFLKSDMEFL